MIGNRRFNILINPKFQLSYMAHMVAVVAIVAICITIADYFFYLKLLKISQSMTLSNSGDFQEFIQRSWTQLSWIHYATVLVIAVVIGVLGLYLSHRIAGPIYRLQKFLEMYREGKRHQPFSLRKNDYFQELVDTVNQSLRPDSNR